MTTRMYLVAGPLILAPERRAELVSHMAADLLETGAYADPIESERQLHRDGYRCLDVMMLLDDARQVAMCEVVAREMADL